MHLERKAGYGRLPSHLAALMAVPQIHERTVSVLGQPQMVSIESDIWDALDLISEREQKSADDLYQEITLYCSPAVDFAASVRVYVLNYFRLASAE